MGGLFSPDMPDPKPPAAMPDDEDELAKRARRNQAAAVTGRNNTGLASTRLAPVPGTLGREYSRPTLGAG